MRPPASFPHQPASMPPKSRCSETFTQQSYTYVEYSQSMAKGTTADSHIDSHINTPPQNQIVESSSLQQIKRKSRKDIIDTGTLVAATPEKRVISYHN